MNTSRIKALLSLIFLITTNLMFAEKETLETQVARALEKIISENFQERQEGQALLIEAGQSEAREVARLALLTVSESGDPELRVRIRNVLKDLFRLDVLTTKKVTLGVSWRWYVEEGDHSEIQSWPMVVLLKKDSLLAKAGLQSHDVIRSFNGQSLNSLEGVEECQRLFGLLPEGEEIVLIVTGSKMGSKNLVELKKEREIKLSNGAHQSEVRKARAGEYEEWLADLKEEFPDE